MIRQLKRHLTVFELYFHIGDSNQTMLRKVEIVCRRLALGMLLDQNLIPRFQRLQVGQHGKSRLLRVFVISFQFKMFTSGSQGGSG